MTRRLCKSSDLKHSLLQIQRHMRRLASEGRDRAGAVTAAYVAGVRFWVDSCLALQAKRTGGSVVPVWRFSCVCAGDPLLSGGCATLADRDLKRRADGSLAADEVVAGEKSGPLLGLPFALAPLLGRAGRSLLLAISRLAWPRFSETKAATMALPASTQPRLSDCVDQRSRDLTAAQVPT